jgi:hypothetical protein
MKYYITYDYVTPESAENGETSENGFSYIPSPIHKPINDSIDLVDDKEFYAIESNVKTFLEYCRDLQISNQSNIQIDDKKPSFYGQSFTEDYEKSEEVTYCIHLEVFNKSQLKRILKHLNVN